MNIQAHMSGQISDQVPNQAGNQLSGLPQQNGNIFHTQVQNLGGQNNPPTNDYRIRQYMREKIYGILMSRHTLSQPSDVASKKIQDISRRLEEGLFNSAKSREEYMDLDTLESRFHGLIRRTPQNLQATQQTQFVNTSAPVGTMIPTPGMQHIGNSNMMVSSAIDPSIVSAGACGSMSSSATSTGNLMPTGNGSFASMRGASFHAAEGSLSNGYQQPLSSFSMNSSGNNVMVTHEPNDSDTWIQ